MKKTIYKILSLALMLGIGVGFLTVGAVFAEEEGGSGTSTSISLSPVSDVLELSSNQTYEKTFNVKNSGSEDMKVEVYAAPYSYVYSEEEDVYKLGFSKENSFTQITRWITFKDANGNWVAKPTYTIKPNEALDISYKVTTPDNIPAGGQYAVLFAHSLTSASTASGIKTEASPGMIIYGRSTEGEAIRSAEISNMKIELKNNEETKSNNFFATAKIKNTGNLDFSAVGKLKVDAIIGFGSYETPNTGTNATTSIIPEVELAISDEWKDSPGFGIYKATWTVQAGDSNEVVEKIIFINPLLFIFITIILLTIIIGGAIIGVRKRKERRSRLAV